MASRPSQGQHGTRRICSGRPFKVGIFENTAGRCNRLGTCSINWGRQILQTAGSEPVLLASTLFAMNNLREMVGRARFERKISVLCQIQKYECAAHLAPVHGT